MRKENKAASSKPTAACFQSCRRLAHAYTPSHIYNHTQTRKQRKTRVFDASPTCLHAFTHSIHTYTHASTQTLVFYLIHACTHSHIRTCKHRKTRVLDASPTCLHAFTHSIHTYTHASTQTLVFCLIHACTHTQAQKNTSLRSHVFEASAKVL
jgi:hypothetical protein